MKKLTYLKKLASVIARLLQVGNDMAGREGFPQLREMALPTACRQCNLNPISDNIPEYGWEGLRGCGARGGWQLAYPFVELMSSTKNCWSE